MGRAGSATISPLHLPYISPTSPLHLPRCKRLHYELCVATRAEAARRKLAAVRGLARLYGALKESAPAHIPEAVPFVAELLEDSELEVRQEAEPEPS